MTKKSRTDFNARRLLTPATIALGARSAYLRRGLGALIAVAGCSVLAAVWSVAGDESRRESIAAARAYENARGSTDRIEAIRDLVRPVDISARLAIPRLVRSLADPSVLVRVEAARSLSRAVSAAAIGNRGVELAVAGMTALEQTLDDPEPAARIAAVYALSTIAASKNPSGIIQPQSLVDTLATMLDDPDVTVRASTIAALGVAGPMAAAQPPRELVAALADESPFNRAAALHTLGRFPQPESTTRATR
jgi:HEAT repeat protein